MKYILLLSMIMCSVCKGQHITSFYLADITTPNANIVMYIDSMKHFKISVYSDNGNILFYDSDDSTLLVKDSLQAIKWLIRLLIENIKTQPLHSETYPDNIGYYDTLPIIKDRPEVKIITNQTQRKKHK